MKRRNFLALPAAGVLVPGFSGRAALAMTDPQRAPLTEESKFQQRLHPDFNTYISGVEYFPLGNGEIIAIVQYAPDRSAERKPTFLGLTLMDAERFARKWSTLLFHPERGFERSALTVRADGTAYAATPDSLTTIEWRTIEQVPVLRIEWKAGPVEVTEELSVPSKGQVLFRNVTVTSSGQGTQDLSLHLMLVPNFAIYDEIGVDPSSVNGRGYGRIKLYSLDGPVTTGGRYDISVKAGPLDAGGRKTVRFVYALNGAEKGVTAKTYGAVTADTVRYWSTKPVMESGDDLLDGLYGIARNGLKALVSRTGKRDSGIWMYNMEWVRDDVMVAVGMLQAGFVDEARTILVKILEKSVGPDGCTIESSRWSGFDHTELDQNGQLLYGIWQYACWTGDVALVKKYWKQIRLAGDFPLKSVFLDPKAGMLRNKREFWERNDSHGLEDGFELTYQFWVALGLSVCSELAAWVGDRNTADRWFKAAASLRDHMLSDPVFRLIEEGHLIKRRTRDGRWQRYMIPPNRAAMPPGSPAATVARPACDPDTSNVYPIMFEMIDPRGELSRNTLADVESLWNQRWDFGGYSRYNTDSEPDPPAPWPFASLFLARAYAEAGDSEKVWRVLRWLRTIHGGRSGGWFERYGPSITPPAPPVCIVGWTYAEITALVVHHLLGFRPGIHDLTIRPRLLEGIDRMRQVFSLRGMQVRLTVERSAGKPSATVNGKTVALKDGVLTVPYPGKAAPAKKSAKSAKGKSAAKPAKTAMMDIRILV